MWRETNIAGVFLPPFLGYMLTAMLIFLPLRWLAVRFHLLAWVWNPPLAQTALYVCILGALIGLL